MALTVADAASALAGVGFNLTPAERALADKRVADGVQDAIGAVETILDERCGLAGRGMTDYPNVAVLLGVELTVTLPEPAPEPVVEEETVVEEPPVEVSVDAEVEEETSPDPSEAEATAEAESQIGVEL